MKRWEYSKACKTAAFLLNQICAVVLVLSVAVCTVYVGSSGMGFLRRDQGFESTEYYKNEVTEQIYRCIRAASRESKFEQNGVYDAKLLVNLKQYAENNTISGGDPVEGGLYYRLTDLLNWSLDGFETHLLMKITYADGSIGYLEKNSDNYTEQSIYQSGAAVSSTVTIGAEDGYAASEPAAELEESWQDIIDNASENGEWSSLTEGGDAQMSVTNVEQIEAVNERYAPVGYDSIISYAEKNGLSTEELQEAYYHLQNVLPVIYNDFYAYKENLEYFSPSMTNMRYFLIPRSAEEINEENFDEIIYTNIKTFGNKKFSTQEELLSIIRGYGDYLVYDSSDMEFDENNMPVSLSELNSYIKGYSFSVDGNYVLAIAIDPNYPASDNLQRYKERYEAVQPVSRLAAYGVFVGAFLYLLTMVYMTMSAGRRNEEERTIYLNRFDRIKTEAAILLLGIPSAAVLVLVAMMSVRNMTTTEFILMGGGATFVLNFLFVTGYLSLVRRMKSKTLWSNSLLSRLTEGIRRLLRNWKATTKTVISYGGLLFGNAVLFCFGGMGIFLAIVLDCLAGVFLIKQAEQRQKILDGIAEFSDGNLSRKIPTERLTGENLILAEAINQMGGGLSAAVEKSIKDERLKSDLITNVSHDIKTPLTSIINYVDLLKREDIQNERAKNYIGILEDKALRLKHLTDDLVEASRISSGNIKLEFTRINFQELIHQTNGEFSEKFEEKGLQFVINMPEEPVVIEADGRRLWRIIENLYNNAAKYAMPNTRVYVDLTTVGHMVRFSIKNISEQPLNIEADELTERFIRGDVARSTEGSGLGLSIAKNLTELQKGRFDIYLDGDLFKVTIIFPEAPARTRTAEDKNEPDLA